MGKPTHAGMGHVSPAEEGLYRVTTSRSGDWVYEASEFVTL